MDKSTFKGTIISIQPRIRLTRSFDESSHIYLGYAITLEGELDNTNTTFSIGIGKAAHAKHQFKVNDIISGESAYQYRILTLNLLSITKSLNSNSSPEAPPSLTHHLPGNWCHRSWKFTEKEDTAGWQPGHMTRSVVAACGAAGCQLRLLLIIGIQVVKSTGSRHSVMVH